MFAFLLILLASAPGNLESEKGEVPFPWGKPKLKVVGEDKENKTRGLNRLALNFQYFT